MHLDLQIFFKKLEMTLMLFSGAWGKMIHEKNLKQKSRDTVPLRRRQKSGTILLYQNIAWALFELLFFPQNEITVQ